MNIEISNKAQEELKKVLEQRNSQDKPLRIYIAGIGWGGPSFGMALDEQKQDDELTQVGEFKFVVDKDVKENYSGFYVDYSNEWLRRGFRINPIGEGSSHC